MHFTTGEEHREERGTGAGVVAKSGCNCGSLLNDSGKKFDKGQEGEGACGVCVMLMQFYRRLKKC